MFCFCPDLPRGAGGGGGGGAGGVPGLGDGPARAQPHQPPEEAEAEGEGLQEGRWRTEGEECDGGLQSQGERPEENDEVTGGDGTPYFYYSKYNLEEKTSIRLLTVVHGQKDSWPESRKVSSSERWKRSWNTDRYLKVTVELVV